MSSVRVAVTLVRDAGRESRSEEPRVEDVLVARDVGLSLLDFAVSSPFSFGLSSHPDANPMARHRMAMMLVVFIGSGFFY